jgi:hypothetical protein
MKGIHNKALILQSWEAGSIRAERLRNGFRGFLEVLFDVGKVVGLELVGKFFELVQWFNDKEGSPSGLLPLLPSFEDLDLPGVIKALPGARALYEEFTGIYYKFAQELTTCVLNWFKLENAPDMHEWRPALVRFDVGLTEDSETIANLVEKANRLQETIQSNLDEIIEAAQAADRTIRDVASLFGIPANWPTIPGLDIGEMKAGLF